MKRIFWFVALYLAAALVFTAIVYGLRALMAAG